MKASFRIEPATEKDAPRIREIYNHYIRTSTCTADTEEKTDEERAAWIRNRDPRYVVSVLRGADHRVLGYSALNRWSERKAYDITAEVSFYLDPKEIGKGLGRLMMDQLLMTAKTQNFHTLIARITVPNESSVKLHESAGFEYVGTFKENAHKFGNYINVGLWQKVFS